MLAKFLVVEESTSIAPHSTAKVKLKDAGISNVWFIFPAVEFAARGLILANAGLLLWPAEARVYNTKDVNQNISAGDCIAINVQMEGEGLKGEGLEAPAEEEAENAPANEVAESETDASPEDEIVTDPNEVDGSEESTEESTEEDNAEAAVEDNAASEAAETETEEEAC